MCDNMQMLEMSNMSRCALFMNIITQNGFYKKL